MQPNLRYERDALVAMKPYLQLANLSPPPALEIEEIEYLLLQRSKPVLNAVFSFEENYDLLVGNYLELENASLTLTAMPLSMPTL